jgi:hypothetical protein
MRSSERLLQVRNPGLPRLRDVRAHEPELQVRGSIAKISHVTRRKIVDADDLEAVAQQPVAEMRSEEPSSACYVREHPARFRP